MNTRKIMMPGLKISEDAMQQSFALEMDLYAAGGRFQWCHVPNGGQRHPAVAAKLKAQGVKAGVWDAVIWGTGGLTYYIELKTENRERHKNGGLSAAQLAFKTDLVRLGVPDEHFAVLYRLADLPEILQKWRLIS